MAVTPSPMSQYNKSNPLVILSKKQYSDTMDFIQTMSRQFIEKIIVSGILVAILGILFLVYGILNHIGYYEGTILGIIFVVFVGISSGYYARYYHLVDRFLHQHEAMQEFNRISDLELNEILMIGNEEVLVCLHKMYELSGEIRIETKYFSLLGVFIILLDIFGLCGFIVYSGMILKIFGGF